MILDQDSLNRVLPSTVFFSHGICSRSPKLIKHIDIPVNFVFVGSSIAIKIERLGL